MTESGIHRDIIVIGASAGGIEPLLTVIRALPADFAASIMVVVHLPATAKSRLAQIIQHVTPLTVGVVGGQEPIEPGRIYVAPPDFHLIVRHGYVELSHGPRENHTRPAVDPLFRSAARAYGPRVIGIILSGTLYDGSSGLMAINAHRGIAIVQDPAEAVVGGMPENAILHANVDHVLPATGIAETLIELVGVPASQEKESAAMADESERVEQVIESDFLRQGQDERRDESTMFICPDCGGVLWQAGTGSSLSFRCHVGHAYSPEVLVALKSEEIEAALWSCVRLLKEKATLSQQLANRSRAAGQNGGNVERFEEQAMRDARYVDVLKDLLELVPGPIGAQAIPQPA
jgi:two-component system chemotaxis response regulator CheB